MPPASRITDMHTCPMVGPGPTPHVGGPVLMGAPTVLTVNLPQARVGDPCVCAIPNDAIVKGSATVLVEKKPAARIGDTTAHGGVLILGAPTVIIGDAAGGGGGGGGGAGPGGGNPGSTVTTDSIQYQPRQAEALVRAANDGAPFCEICARQAAKEEEAAMEKMRADNGGEMPMPAAPPAATPGPTPPGGASGLPRPGGPALPGGASAILSDAVGQVASRTGLSPDTIAAMAGNGVAQLQQWAPQAWVAEAERAGSALNRVADTMGYLQDHRSLIPGAEAQLLALRDDPGTALAMAMDHAPQAIQAMRDAGAIPPGTSEEAGYRAWLMRSLANPPRLS